MTYFSYSEWAETERSDELVRLDKKRVEGFALHWPAIKIPVRTVSAVKVALRAIREDHIKVQGWADIAYQLAFDQMGNIYQLRGLRFRSAANGDRDVNERFCAFVLMVSETEKPTTELVRKVNTTLKNAREDFYARGNRVVGHKDIRPEPTACPGPFVYDLIQDRTFHV